MTEPNIPWPRKGDKAFINGTFGPTHVNLDGLAVLYSNSVIAWSFKEAADLVVKVLQTGEGRVRPPDRFFFPIAYLYRHSLELHLKCLLAEGIRQGIITQADNVKEAMSGHNLHKLWNHTRKLIEAMWPGEDPAQLNATEHVIFEFHKIDKSGQEFRYARDKDDRLHLTDAPKLVDLINLKEVMDGIFRFLDACSAGFDEADAY